MDALSFGGTTSGAECLQAAQPGALVVKAFNSLGAGLLGNAAFGSHVADGFLCGEDAFAKEQVSQLVREAGLQPVDVGRLRNARYLEAMAMLWIDLAVHQHRKPAFAFKIISRKEEVQA
jgi:predicted dinucleotide-binding enzyme